MSFPPSPITGICPASVPVLHAAAVPASLILDKDSSGMSCSSSGFSDVSIDMSLLPSKVVFPVMAPANVTARAVLSLSAESALSTYPVLAPASLSFAENEWDCVISNLALHYIEDIVEIFQKVYRTLKPGGIFLFNIEHPVFTAGVGQDWIYTDDGKPQYWAIDNYFITGERNTHFLGCDVVKQHHTLTQIIMGLLNNGFELKVVEEAEPPKEMMDIPGMEDELRRPMMLLVKAIAKK